MNDQIVKLFVAFLILFGLLVYFTSKWTVFDAAALNDNSLNKRTFYVQEKIKRGEIIADDGKVLAESVKVGGGIYKREYPQGSLFAQTVGYWLGSGDDAGLEAYYNDALEGSSSTVSSVFGPLSDQVDDGDDVHLTIDPRAQAVARSELGGRVGAVVALDPRNGDVLALYADPTYDPNHPNAKCDGVSCSYFDQATQAAQPPGSTFKIVTAAPAMNTGRYTPESELNGNSPQTVSGVPLHNDDDQSFGVVPLSYALEQSINTIWAKVGVSIGIPTMTEYMKRYGFYSVPPIDLPSDELRASDVLNPTTGRAYPAGSADEDIGRIAIGQGGLAVAPLQMAMVASAVADDGTLMKPHLAAYITDPQGQTVRTIHPSVDHQVMSAHSAQEINGMMRSVVDEGTGEKAKLASGLQFAGKTGTASVGADGSGRTDPWFIGFAPANDPKVAVAVMLENTDGDYGGQVAGPIASAVVQTLIDEGK